MSAGKHTAADSPRQSAVKLITVATVLFLLALCALFGVAKLLPQAAKSIALSGLERGNFSMARFYARFTAQEVQASLLEQCDYMEATARMAQGEYDEAIALFRSLGAYSDAGVQAQECLYRKADFLFGTGALTEAAELFHSLVPYADTADRYNACLYRQAEELRSDGQLLEAALLFDSLGSYTDARQIALELAKAVTGKADADEAMAALHGLTPEALAHQAELAQAREELRKNVIDVGFYHTLGLRSDGKVLACGSNSFGQCDVDSWQDITAVAAGAYHSVGLRADGTVVATGRDSEGQCQVAGWTDIVQIAAADYATLGLRADGTLVYTGYNSYDGLAAYNHIRSIAAGSYAAAALLSDGSAVISHETARSGELVSLVDIAVNTACALGLRSDGTVVCPALESNSWQDVIAISLSGTGALGLTLDGRVLCASFRSGSGPDLSAVTDAAGIAGGGTHWAILHRDGRVSVFGDSSQGQADTASWQLF